MSNSMRRFLMLVIVWLVGLAAYGSWLFVSRPTITTAPPRCPDPAPPRCPDPAPPAPPIQAPPPAATLKFDDYKFDFALKNRQLDWCEAHGGVAVMTFTTKENPANVLCLRRSAVFADGGLPK